MDKLGLDKEEDSLLNGLREFKRQALIEVHDRYYPAIYRYIAFKVGDKKTAEDLTSEVFVRLLDAVQSRRGPRKTIKGWLYRVASNVVNDYFRKGYRWKKNVLLNETSENEQPKPLGRLIQKENFHELYEAIDELTQSQQDVVALRFGYGMRIREVANTIGKSEGAVKQLQARALASLGRLLAPRRRSQHS